MGALPHIVEDCQGFLQVFSDGSVFRLTEIDFNIPVINESAVIWKDTVFDKNLDLHLRLYKPTSSSGAAAPKLPIVFYLRGGGFCLGSRTWPNFHSCCLRLASSLNAVVIAPDYRLAPEHKLPAAMDDTLTVFKWLQGQALSKICDAWLSEGVDFGQVFVIGDSSGGNIAHHMAVQLGSGSPELAPVCVRGYVLLAPFFGGIVRTKSEEGPDEALLNLDVLDRFWRLSLPDDGTRDHPFSNPFGPASPNLELVNLDPMLIIVGGSELLKDRVEDYAKRLKQLGKQIEYVEFEGKQHGFFTNGPYYSKEANGVVKLIKHFIFENNSN